MTDEQYYCVYSFLKKYWIHHQNSMIANPDVLILIYYFGFYGEKEDFRITDPNLLLPMLNETLFYYLSTCLEL